MRVAVVFFPARNREKLRNISMGLAHGIENQGHHVDLIDGEKEIGKKLTIYQYIAVGTESSGFSGKTPEKIAKFLSHAGSLIGKKCLAFVTKAMIGAQKGLLHLMKRMEHEGMYLTYSKIFESPEMAEIIGKNIHIDIK